MPDQYVTVRGNMGRRLKDLGLDADGHTILADEVVARLYGKDGKELNTLAPHCLAHKLLSVDASDAGNDLATLIGGAVGTPVGTGNTLADYIALGLSLIRVSVRTNPIRVRFDAGDPATAGEDIAKDIGQAIVWDVDDFTKIHLIGIGGAADVAISFWA
jgi:hypothetical protein